jgi:pyruvate/2-oxoglutarate dehydrogenase complex dihydrolipoamide acyltransferase (E2) component
MAKKILVPLLGEGVEEVTVIKWLKHEGDAIKELEPMVEVNTDKVDTEIPAPETGTILKIVAQEGLPAKVGSILAYIGNPGESVEPTAGGTSKPSAAKPAPLQPPNGPPAEGQEPVAAVTQAVPAVSQAEAAPKGEIGFISPVVAKIASEKGVNLSEITGTGLNGRVTKNDVLKFVEIGPSPAPSKSVRPAAAPPIAPTQGDELIKHTVIRTQIAEHMVMSKHTSPHVLTVMEADMSKVVAHRTDNKEIFARDGVKLTYTSYFIAAIVAGLKTYPKTNSSWTNEGILVHKAVNIGMATSLGEEGLIVPVIKNADNLSLLALARAVNDLATRARSKKLQPDEVRGGTFTLTNHGTSGSLFAFPVINQPQAGILGMGAMQQRVVVIKDAIAIRPMIYLSFVFDHRILDGASADSFLMKVKETLEKWA